MSTPLRQNLTWPVGRLISGSVSKFRDKDRAGKALTTKDGKPRQEFSFGVAFEKMGTLAFWETAWGAIAYTIGRTAFPQLFQQDGNLLPGRTFSWKVTDGDSQVYNTEGKRPCDTPEWKGCYIVWFKSQYPPSTWNHDGSAPIAADSIKCGNFVQVCGSIDSNGDAGKPGVYMNHAMVALSGYHPDGEITSGPDVGSAGFGAGPAPANMQRVPAGALPQPPQASPPGGYAAPAAPPQYAPPPAAMAPTPVRPHPGIMTPPGALPTQYAPPAAAPPGAGYTPQYPSGAPAAIPPPPPPPPPPAGPQTTAKAGGATWDQLAAAGWTIDVARAHGMIA